MEKVSHISAEKEQTEHQRQISYEHLLHLISLDYTELKTLSDEERQQAEDYLRSILESEDDALVLPLIQANKDKSLAAEYCEEYLKKFTNEDFLFMTLDEVDTALMKPRKFLHDVFSSNALQDELGGGGERLLLDKIKSKFPKELLWNDEKLLQEPAIENFLKKWTYDSLAYCFGNPSIYLLCKEKYGTNEEINQLTEAAITKRLENIVKNYFPGGTMEDTKKLLTNIEFELDAEMIIRNSIKKKIENDVRLYEWDDLKELLSSCEKEGLLSYEEGAKMIEETVVNREGDITQFTVEGFCKAVGIEDEKNVFDNPLTKRIATKGALAVLSRGYDPEKSGFYGFPQNSPEINRSLKEAIIAKSKLSYDFLSIRELVEKYGGTHQTVLYDPEIKEVLRQMLPDVMNRATGREADDFKWLLSRVDISPQQLREMVREKAEACFFEGNEDFFDDMDVIVPFSQQERDKFLLSTGIAAQEQFLASGAFMRVGQFAKKYEQLRPRYYQTVSELIKKIQDERIPSGQRLGEFVISLSEMTQGFGDDLSMDQFVKDNLQMLMKLSLEHVHDKSFDDITYPFLIEYISEMDKNTTEQFLHACLKYRMNDSNTSYFHTLVAHAVELGVEMRSIIEMTTQKQQDRFVEIIGRVGESGRFAERVSFAEQCSQILLHPQREALMVGLMSGMPEEEKRPVAHTIADFLDRYAIGSSKKGATVAVLEMVKIIENGSESLANALPALSKRLEMYDSVLRRHDQLLIPDGLRVSIGMEYEITHEASSRFQEVTSRNFKEDIGGIAQYANIGRGNDGAFEIATQPTDNPYMLMLEMKLISDLGYIDFNFTPGTVHEQSARGCHISIGGEQFKAHQSEQVSMLQNALAISGWAGVPGGSMVGGGSINSHGYGDRSDVLGTESTESRVYEFRGLSIDKQEPFERTVLFLHHAGIGINALEKVTTTQSFDFAHMLKGLDISSVEKCLLLFAPQTKLDSIDEKTKKFAYEYLKMAKQLHDAIEQHNQQFLTQELVGYFDAEGAFVDSESGTVLEKRFKQYILDGNYQSSLEVYMQDCLTIPTHELFCSSRNIYNVANRLSNMYLKFRKGETKQETRILNTSSNTAAFLSETKVKDGLEFPDAFVENQREKSVFDEDAIGRQGYYYMQDATPEMLIHKVQQIILEYQKSFEPLTEPVKKSYATT